MKSILKTTTIILGISALSINLLFSQSGNSNAQEVTVTPIEQSENVVIQSNSNPIEESKKGVISNGYYEWEVTGDKKTDAANANAAAEKFRTENPEAYRQISKDQKTGIIEISQADFESMSAEKQLYIRSNTDKR